MLSRLSLFLVIVSKVCSATPDITIFIPEAENQPVTDILSGSIVAFSTVDVVLGITEYAVGEVDTLLVLENSATTTTLFTTPLLASFTLLRGSDFLENTFLDTITSGAHTFIESGFDACTASVPQTAGGEVLCIEVDFDNGSGFSSGTTIGFNAVLSPVFTITQTSSNPAGTTSFPTITPPPVTAPSLTLPPSPTTTIGPTTTHSWAINTYASVTYLQVSLVATAIWTLSFFILG